MSADPEVMHGMSLQLGSLRRMMAIRIDSWIARRPRQKPSPMPPAGAGQLTSDELAALTAWLMATPSLSSCP
jgi:hypothetical protein